MLTISFHIIQNMKISQHKIPDITRYYIMASEHLLLYFSFSVCTPPPPLFSDCVFTTPSPVLLSSFSLLYPAYTDQNRELHLQMVCLSQSDTYRHGNRAEPGLHFTLDPPPSVISVL